MHNFSELQDEKLFHDTKRSNENLLDPELHKYGVF